MPFVNELNILVKPPKDDRAPITSESSPPKNILKINDIVDDLVDDVEVNSLLIVFIIFIPENIKDNK